MSERTVESVRAEITAERQRLDEDIAQLRSEMRSLAIFAAAGLVVVGLVAWLVSRRKGAASN